MNFNFYKLKNDNQIVIREYTKSTREHNIFEVSDRNVTVGWTSI